MKFFKTNKNLKVLYIKNSFYESVFNNINVSQCSLFFFIRLGLLRKKNIFDKQKENLLDEMRFQQFLDKTKQLKKLKFLTTSIQLSQKRIKNLTILDRFLNLFFKDGLKSKYLNYFNKSVEQVYYMLFFFSKNLNYNEHMYVETLFSTSVKKNFYTFSSILSEIVLLLEPIFSLKIQKVEKKFRKFLKKKFTGKISYIQPRKRLHVVLRALLQYLNLFKPYHLHDRLYYSFFKTLVEQKQSFLYKKKIYMYTKLFKKDQVKGFK